MSERREPSKETISPTLFAVIYVTSLKDNTMEMSDKIYAPMAILFVKPRNQSPFIVREHVNPEGTKNS